MRSAPLLLLLLCAPLLTACGDKCRLAVTNEITDPADVTLTVIEVRLEGTSYWGEVDLLDSRIDPEETRSVRVEESGPFTLGVRASDSVGRTWTRLDAVRCAVPDEGLELAITNADRDQPCNWMATNDTGVGILSLRLRRTGTIAWAREVLEEGLGAADSVTFVMDDDEFTWDLQAVGEGGDTWTQSALAACVDGAPRTLPIGGAPDAPEEEAR